MDNLKFYPYLTDDLMEKSGCMIEKFQFFYYPNDMEAPLRGEKKGVGVIKITDPLDMWSLAQDGITFKKKVSIAYPDFLFGAEGIACKNAEIGICIMWTNNRLTQTGLILPNSDITTAAGRTCYFEHTFNPGEVEGDLQLSVCLYVKKSASEILDGEEELMNEEGVTIGELDDIVVDFDSVNMEFPIEELYSDKEPLWWIEFSQWEDPKSLEKFTKDNICIYLNPYYSACPMTDGNIKNVDLLIDILATSYLMIFERLSEEDLQATRNDVGLEANSICLSLIHI